MENNDVKYYQGNLFLLGNSMAIQRLYARFTVCENAKRLIYNLSVCQELFWYN